MEPGAMVRHGYYFSILELPLRTSRFLTEGSATLEMIGLWASVVVCALAQLLPLQPLMVMNWEATRSLPLRPRTS